MQKRRTVDGSYEQVPADVQEKLLKAYTDTDDE